ncbi:hypothetical protein BB560_000420 [Smittium megazygosporum]|uniref:TATA element modulatory factor 1 TATA binding domain-containing protein n=1 Tax=Smittium megazygosporum TaxID=133381 RepID=A0A2T9ZKE7_9FUNG|nr:hypothetical protein BB560_000420 [Smittium megazygosporum]
MLINKLNDSIKLTNEYKYKYEQLLAQYNAEKSSARSNNYNQLANKYRIVEKELQSSKDSLYAVKTALNKSDTDNISLNSKLADLQAKSNSIDSLNKELKSTNSALESEVFSLKDENAELLEKVNLLERKLLIMEDENRSKEARSLLQTRELRRQRLQLEEEKESISNKIYNDSAPMLRKVEHLQNTLALTKTELSQKEEEFKENLSKLQKQNTTFEQKITDLTNQLSKESKLVEELSSKLSSSQENVNVQNNQKVLNLESRISQLEREKSDLVVELESVKKQNIELSRNEKNEKNEPEPVFEITDIEKSPNTKESSEPFTNLNSIESVPLRNSNSLDSASVSSGINQTPSQIGSVKEASSFNKDSSYLQLSSQISSLKNQLRIVLLQKSNLDIELVEKSNQLESMQLEMNKKTEQISDLQEQIDEIKKIYKMQLEDYMS